MPTRPRTSAARWCSTILLAFASACTLPKSNRVESRRVLERYKAEHYAAVPQVAGNPWSWPDFETALLDHRLVLLGDVHDDAGLHANLLELIRRSSRVARRAGWRTRLFVEFVGLRDEADVASFLAGRTQLDALRRTIRSRWPTSWLESRELDRGFYRRLLETARAEGIGIEALESIPRPRLQFRDAAMAERITARRAASDDTLDLVLVGHAHLLGPRHLVDMLGDDGANALLVLPNVDVRGLETHPFVQLGRRLLAWRR